MRFPRIVYSLTACAVVLAAAACSGTGTPAVPNAAPDMVPNAASRTSASVASTTTSTGTTVPTHIPTYVFDEYYGPGGSAASSLVQQYVSYAQGGYGNTKAVVDCDQSGSQSCKSIFYFDPNFVYDAPQCLSSQAQSVMGTSNESWFVHLAGYTDAAHRLYGTYSQPCSGKYVSTPVYLLNDSNPSVISYFQSYLQTSADSWDAYFMDDTSARVLTQGYGPGGGFCHNDPPSSYCNTTQEYPTDASVAAAHDTFANGMSHKNGSPMQFFFNGIGFNGNTPVNLNILSGSNHFSGGVCENCVISTNVFRPTMYAKVLNAMAQVDQIPGAAFVELNTGTEPAGSAMQQHERMLTTAMAWLGFSPGQTIVQANLEDNTTNLPIWAEDSIYPTQPVESMTSSSNDIQVSPGVFVREFAQCYNAGVAIGQCAAIVNSNSAVVTVDPSWLKQKYTHVVALTGGDIESGGTMSLTSNYFVAGRTQVQASLGTLLVK